MGGDDRRPRPIDERIERLRLEREAQERRAARRSHPGAQDTDPPLPPAFPPPPIQGRPGDGNPHVDPSHGHSWLAKVGTRWGTVVAMILAAAALVDIGVRVAARNDSYAKQVELERITQRLDGIAAKLEEVKLSDIKPLATNANAVALDAQEQVKAVRKDVQRIIRSIAGFNARAAARHQITPLPLQDE